MNYCARLMMTNAIRFGLAIGIHIAMIPRKEYPHVCPLFLLQLLVFKAQCL
jgi:hypothetical protein|tara:strand:- start:670 stop:822 length:153 start_codon:yes stop_codon:yes gene_type:complete